MGLVSAVSDVVNIREDALRLLLSIIAGYPLAALHRTYFYKTPPITQHAFFTVVGVLIYLFNCGTAIWHTLFSIIAAWAIVNFIPGTILSIVLAHVIFLGYLMVGYWYAESATYDITWTTPFCILTLRLIGLVMDVYDGHQKLRTAPDQKDKPKSEPNNAPKSEVSNDKPRPAQLDNAIRDRPDILEVAAYSLFFAGTLVGPQFPLARFRAFVNGEYHEPREPKNGIQNLKPRDSAIMASCQRFVAGIFFAVIHQWGMVWVPDSYIIGQEFANLPFFWKVFWNTVWFRATMYRYCIAWLLTEGAAILCGLGYNGQDVQGNDRWDGVRDLHIVKFETGSDFNSVVESFNCGTNAFAKNHIFKRLRWLGNKYLSQGITLFYLAVWHGYHLGYFMLFTFEFACVMAQEQLFELIRRMPSVAKVVYQPWMAPLRWLFGKVIINISMAFAFLTFGLIKKEIWIGPLKAMYFYGYILYFVACVGGFLLLKYVVRPPKRKTM